MCSAQKRRNALEAPAGYSAEIAPWIWCLEDARLRTESVIDNIEQSALDWTLPEGGNSIGTLLYHIAAIEMDYLYSDVLEEPWDSWPEDVRALLTYDVRDHEGRLSAVKGASLEDHVHRLNTSRSKLLDCFRTMTIQDFGRARSLVHYDVTPQWVLYHLTQHEAEHRSQIADLRGRIESIGISAPS